ncbi:MAG: class I SAM-dependent methyltransferase [Thermomicrobiales bacterium]
MSEAQRYDDQRSHFEQDEHQYPVDAILNPPLHTTLELEGVVQAMHAAPPDGEVVDFGAGTGRISVALAKNGYRVLAVDISESSLSDLKQVVTSLSLPSIETSTELPTDRTFAAVVGGDVLHHVDLDEFLPRFHDLLDDGGILVFTEPGGMNPAWYPYLAIVADLRVERRIVFCNVWTLRTKLRRHGFRRIDIRGVGILPRSLFGWSERACRINDRLGNLPILRWFAYRYLIVASR